MPPALTETVGTLGSRWRGLPGGLRVLIVLAVVGVALGGAITWSVNNAVFEEYQVLFSNLSPEDAGAVVEALRTAKVPYRTGDGNQVLVPASRVHEWRMRLASQGVPSGGTVGFEIFDKNQFGLTDFSQRLNYQRALQGELARTIGQLREVQAARVHLALPAPRVFASQDKPASASVVLRLRSGAQLRADQVRGIVHLVTAAVEGLTPERVTVVETGGRVLASGQDRGPGVSGNQSESRNGIEHEIERRVQSLLDPIVGAGHSAVRVSAAVNFDQIERTEERFDPKPLVRSQTKTSETAQGSSSQPTTVGTGTSARTEAASASNQSKRDNEQTNYEIARTVERTVVAPGDVRRLSIAVLLDVPVVNNNRTPRGDEEIQRIKKLVASAAGVREDRKDEVEILQVPFDPTVAAPGDAAGGPGAERPASRPPVWIWAAAGAVGGLLLGGLGFFFMRSKRRKTALQDAVIAAVAADESLGALIDSGGAAPAGVGGAPSPELVAAATRDPGTRSSEPIIPLNLRPKLTPPDVLRERIRAAAREHPDEVAQILRAWIVKRRQPAS